jgi:four helix bundle protein
VIAGQIKSYTDLLVWQKGHTLAMSLYGYSVKNNKKQWDFIAQEIWKQAVRAAFSVPANIVEGYYSHKGKSFASHLEISRGSAGETQYWVRVLSETNLLGKPEGDNLVLGYGEVIAMLTGLVNKIRK